ncbi:MAG: hypothetical protein NTX71_01690 [Candidatus Aureabacteria bacterium]|nr:hypothetical protein [Candidatus Auribacterota bacterium]
MPKRNRKCDEGLSMAALTGKWVLLAAMAVSLSLLYVWQHVQLVRTGYTIKRIEREVAEWQKTNETLKLENERLKNPQRIEHVLAQNNLGLVFPQAKDIVRLRYYRHANERDKEKSGSEGGTDTLLSYRSGGGGAGHDNM